MDVYLFWLLRASLVLSLSTVVAWSMMSWNPLHHPRWYRIAWALVLLQGVVFFPWSMQVTLPAIALATHQPTVPVAEVSSDIARINITPSTLLPEETAFEIPPAESENRDREGESFPQWNTSPPLLKDHSRSAGEQLVTTPTQTSRATAPFSPSYLSDLSKRFTQGNEMLYAELAAWPWYRGLISLWIAGLISFLMYLVSNYIQLGRILRAAKNARPKWSRELQQISVELNLRERVRLLVHREVGPFLCWTPHGYQIVVPVGLWNQLSDAERLAVLHHELCHLRRGDLWKALSA